MHRAVLLPGKAQGDVLAGELLLHACPVGLAGVGHGPAARAVEARLKLGVADALGQRPGEARLAEP